MLPVLGGIREEANAIALLDRLLELADSIEEVKVTCQFCNRKAIFNLRLQGDRAELDGPQIELGGNDRYAPACFTCYSARTGRFPRLA